MHQRQGCYQDDARVEFTHSPLPPHAYPILAICLASSYHHLRHKDQPQFPMDHGHLENSREVVGQPGTPFSQGRLRLTSRTLITGSSWLKSSTNPPSLLISWAESFSSGANDLAPLVTAHWSNCNRRRSISSMPSATCNLHLQILHNAHQLKSTLVKCWCLHSVMLSELCVRAGEARGAGCIFQTLACPWPRPCSAKDGIIFCIGNHSMLKFNIIQFLLSDQLNRHMMGKCQRCLEEEEAGMACLTCPCSSLSTNTSTLKKELAMENLLTLDMVQLHNLCVRVNLQPSRSQTWGWRWGDRVTLIDRLMRRFPW